jgi:hypothetical protein
MSTTSCSRPHFDVPDTPHRARHKCLIATATVLELPLIGSSHAPTSCLCTGRNGSGQVALPLVVLLESVGLDHRRARSRDIGQFHASGIGRARAMAPASPKAADPRLSEGSLRTQPRRRGGWPLSSAVVLVRLGCRLCPMVPSVSPRRGRGRPSMCCGGSPRVSRRHGWADAHPISARPTSAQPAVRCSRPKASTGPRAPVVRSRPAAICAAPQASSSPVRV